MTKLVCPICQSNLIHERVDDGIIINEISPNGEMNEVHNVSNGYDSVSCGNDSSHEITDELINAVLDIVQ